MSITAKAERLFCRAVQTQNNRYASSPFKTQRQMLNYSLGFDGSAGLSRLLLSYIAARGPGLPYLMPSNKHAQNFHFKFLRVFQRELSLVFSFKTSRGVSAAWQEISNRESETLQKHTGVNPVSVLKFGHLI